MATTPCRSDAVVFIPTPPKKRPLATPLKSTVQNRIASRTPAGSGCHFHPIRYTPGLIGSVRVPGEDF